MPPQPAKPVLLQTAPSELAFTHGEMHLLCLIQNDSMGFSRLYVLTCLVGLISPCPNVMAFVSLAALHLGQIAGVLLQEAIRFLVGSLLCPNFHNSQRMVTCAILSLDDFSTQSISSWLSTSSSSFSKVLPSSSSCDFIEVTCQYQRMRANQVPLHPLVQYHWVVQSFFVSYRELLDTVISFMGSFCWPLCLGLLGLMGFVTVIQLPYFGSKLLDSFLGIKQTCPRSNYKCTRPEQGWSSAVPFLISSKASSESHSKVTERNPLHQSNSNPSKTPLNSAQMISHEPSR
ncbi:uncharacterized protein G2W53_022590 [Senna tora]|uniref:Uncharacterized protein n=1 Tax=Senna tora TaxID=362788 RepID=A0A834TP31_9FABA|nr:uncharacterized protein G2W53_022590 [Senna tora]